jgi:hypothetical protein
MLSPLPSSRASLHALILALLTLVAGAGRVMASEESRIFLSWHAPYGQPGATSDLTVACGDTMQEDTLYLCCDPGSDSKTFNGFEARLFFRAALGDTLGPYWSFGTGMKGLRNIRAVFQADSTDGLPSPWGAGGFGAINYDGSRGAGDLKMIFAVPPQMTGSTAFGKRYCFARLMFRRPPTRLARCHQPVCIEWSTATLAFSYGVEAQVARGERFATVNSPDGSVCSSFRGHAPPPVWKPKDGRRPH